MINIRKAAARMRQDIYSGGKTAETESLFERAVTKPLGYLTARLFINLGWTPGMVTMLSMCVGFGGGALFFSGKTAVNIVGVILMILAGLFNAADRQMASLTGDISKAGKILDSLCVNAWYAAVYASLAVRLYPSHIPFTQTKWGWLIWVTVFAIALFANQPQRMLARRYRSAHLFLSGAPGAEFETSTDVFRVRNALPKNARTRRTYMWLHAFRVRIKEALSPDTYRLFKAFETAGISDDVRHDYVEKSRRYIRLTRLLDYNLRAFVLFVCVIADVPVIALAFEVIALEALMLTLRGKYESIARDCLYNHKLPGSEIPYKKPNHWTAVFFCLGIAGVISTLSSTDLSAVDWKGDVLGKIGVWLPSIMGVWLLIYIIHTVTYAVIIGKDSRKIKPLRLFKMVIAGFALNNVTPVGFAGGEPYRIMELKGSIGTEKATAAAFTFTIMNTISNVALWGAGALMYILTGFKGGIGMTFIALVVLACMSYLMYLFFRSKGDSFVTGALGALSKLPLAGRYFSKLLAEKRESLENIDREMGAFRERKRDFYISTILEFSTRLLEAAEMFILLRVLGIEFSFFYMVFSFAAASLFGNLIFFIPMQMGSREASFALTLSWAGAASSAAVTASLLCRIRDISYLILGVGLMLMKPQDEEAK